MKPATETVCGFLVCFSYPLVASFNPISMSFNKLVIVGNGFDLAHGLKTSYQHFVDWYMCQAFDFYCNSKRQYQARSYSDSLLSIRDNHTGMMSTFSQKPIGLTDVLNLLQSNGMQTISFQSTFFERLVNGIQSQGWVDIEREYFSLLKLYFVNLNNIYGSDSVSTVKQLNKEFDFLISKLTEYLKGVNEQMTTNGRLRGEINKSNFATIFQKPIVPDRFLKVLNFNYTDTLTVKGYVDPSDVIHIHGQVSDVENNPIIFGYGDETDPAYQQIEDSGQNAYLEHIKSFGYFRTHQYHQLLSFINSHSFKVTVLGHSCGLSDRIMLNTIFEHRNCHDIDIFYHRRADGSDNFKEITQEISRHFKPANKDLLRSRVQYYRKENFIPQLK